MATFGARYPPASTQGRVRLLLPTNRLQKPVQPWLRVCQPGDQGSGATPVPQPAPQKVAPVQFQEGKASGFGALTIVQYWRFELTWVAQACWYASARFGGAVRRSAVLVVQCCALLAGRTAARNAWTGAALDLYNAAHCGVKLLVCAAQLPIWSTTSAL